MTVNTDYDLSCGLTDSCVQSSRDNSARIIQKPNLRMVFLVFQNNLSGFIRGYAIHHKDFHLLYGIILHEDGIQALNDGFSLVMDGKN